ICGVPSLTGCMDKIGVIADRAGSAIRLKALFQRTSAAKFEILFILGGRQSIIQSLSMQGNAPCIMSDAGTDPLYAWVFRRKHRFGKNETLVMICPVKTTIQASSWEPTERMDLRYGTGSPYSTPYPEVAPARLAEICEQTLFAKVA
ncbi:MAG TPA: hypothetical protein VGL53_29540, partial [Bryobacteraceae bacterium]